MDTLAENIAIDPDRRTPLHSQIQEELMRLIDCGELTGALPGPELLARALRVCSGSARRAYSALIEAGIVEQDEHCYRVADFVT